MTTEGRHRLVVTFDYFREDNPRELIGFGERFFTERKIDALHFIAKDNHWFQTPELEAAIATALPLAKDYGSIFSYGSSMGGMAALRYGARLGAETAIVFWPQFAIDPTEPPHDGRWGEYHRNVAANSLPAAANRYPKRAFAFYDPHDADAAHIDLYAGVTEVTRIHVPFVGHPAIWLVAATDLLPDTILRILNDEFDVARFRRELRERRLLSDYYLFLLSRRVRRLSTMNMLAKRALALAEEREAAMNSDRRPPRPRPRPEPAAEARSTPRLVATNGADRVPAGQTMTQTPHSPRPAGHPPVQSGRVGVLLVNLGTPDATDYRSMRRYLKEFLSDPRVIETPRVLWWFVLNLVILSFRPTKSGRKYDKIWNRERNESPLKTFTRAQAEKLEARLPAARDGKVVVDWAMRYGNPSIPSCLAALQKQGCDRILVVPLYPQYSAASTATACDAVFDALRTMRWQPSIRIAPPYYDDPAYIAALADSVRASLAAANFEPEVVLASYHGLPKAYFEKGDPYYCHCAKTTRLLGVALGLPDDRLMMTFQSRFGPAKWLEPASDRTLIELAKRGVRKVAVVTPGFSADCLETIEEIGMENRAVFLENGGAGFHRVDCLNDSEPGLRVIEAIVRRELAGWIEA